MTEYTVTPRTGSHHTLKIVEQNGHVTAYIHRADDDDLKAVAYLEPQSFSQMVAQYSEHHCPPAKEIRELRKKLDKQTERNTKLREAFILEGNARETSEQTVANTREELRIANVRIKELHRMLAETGKLTIARVPIHDTTPTTAEQRRAVKLALNSMYGKNVQRLGEFIDPAPATNTGNIQGRTPYTTDELFSDERGLILQGACKLCGCPVHQFARRTHTQWHNDVADL